MQIRDFCDACELVAELAGHLFTVLAGGGA